MAMNDHDKAKARLEKMRAKKDITSFDFDDVLDLLGPLLDMPVLQDYNNDTDYLLAIERWRKVPRADAIKEFADG